MFLACDEAGFTGPDLLAKDQRYFAFASVNTSDDEAWLLIDAARREHPVQMPELKASKLMASNQGRRLIAKLVQDLSGRFAVNAHDKLMALCGWVFEYVFEPVFQDDPHIFYEKEFHLFVAMYCYLWFKSDSSEVKTTLEEFQSMMRSKDIAKAPSLFSSTVKTTKVNQHPFELIRRFATAHRTIIAEEVRDTHYHSFDKGTWTLDLSASGLWSHLNHWGQHKEPLTVICDESKPLRAVAAELNGDAMDAAIVRARRMKPDDPLGWKLFEPVRFADSRAHPSVQLADILASTVVYCYTNGVPGGFEDTAQVLQEGMLKDSIFPDLERVNLKNDSVKVHYSVLNELVARAEGGGVDMSVGNYFALVEQAIASGELALE